MELRQLRYFVILAEELHFGRAAERLHIVQPAVSQQLRRLEAELGARLVDRSTRRVALTAAGQRFLPEARAVLAAAERARDAVAGTATLRLGTSTGLGERLPALLAELARRAPGQTVELVRVPRRPGCARSPPARSTPRWSAARRPIRACGSSRSGPTRSPSRCPAPTPPPPRAPSRCRALRDLPLRLPPRAANLPLYDLVTGACHAAGFQPQLAPALNDQDMLAAIAAGPPTWTVYYRAQAAAIAAAGRQLPRSGPAARHAHEPRRRRGPQPPAVDVLLAACRTLAGAGPASPT